MTKSRLTCVVPTHNRPDFLRRLLYFYSRFPPGFPFLLLDSSIHDTAAENRETAHAFGKTLEIYYQHSDMNVTEKCSQGLSLVESPFVVFCADDDYLFSTAVWKCVDFLKNHLGFASAMGRTAQLNPSLPIWCCRVLKGYSVENDCPLERCQQLASNWFTNFYAVYRTETMVDLFETTAANTDSSQNYHIAEMLFSQLSAMRGRIKVLPLMYSLMERHSANAGAAMRSGVRPQAEVLYQRFKSCLCEQFVHAGIGCVEAEQHIDEAFGFFRDPDRSVRRRSRSTAESVRHLLAALKEKASHQGMHANRHRRFLRSSDVVGCEVVWRESVQMMKCFPSGMHLNDLMLHV